MTLKKIAAVTLLLGVAVAAFSQQEEHGQQLSGSELLSYCKSATVTNTGTWCLGYVLGVWHMTTAERLVCPPADITSGQLRRAVVRYLQRHPEVLNRQPAGLVLEALESTFPCVQHSDGEATRLAFRMTR